MVVGDWPIEALDSRWALLVSHITSYCLGVAAGGHTAWSRAWLVNLRARLFNGTEALQSLRGIVNEQSVGSLYTLHPALTRLHAKDLGDCTSCFGKGDQKKTSLTRLAFFPRVDIPIRRL